MLVGIMSMQRIDNYGSYLQALGLKLTLESLGHKVIFVDYEVEKGISEQNWKNTSLLRRIRRFFRKPILDQNYKETPYIHADYPYLGMTEKRNYRSKVDVLIIGSDEVFNCLQRNPCVGYSLELLGARNKARRLISYAASCGNLTIERLQKYNKQKEVAKYLCKFNALSVRDANTYNVVKKLTNKDIQYHLDPVLISEYGDLFVDTVKEQDYILVYGYPSRFSEEEGKIIREYANSRNKKLISMCGKQSFCDEYIACSTLEVLSYFKHADSIITDTFHGSIFSTLVHKPFVAFIRPTEQYGYGNEEKLGDLLIRLKLESRGIYDVNQLVETMETPIDYTETDRIRQKERKRSLEFLERELGRVENE